MNQLELNRKELKRKAREQMKKATPHFLLFTLVYLLLTMGPSLVADVTGVSTITLDYGIPFFPLFLSLLLILYQMVMRFGYEWWALKSYRGEQGDFGCLIDGFSMAFQVILLEFLVFLRAFLWILAGCIPATIVVTILVLLLPTWAAILVYIVFLIFVFLYTYCVMVRYDMTMYVLIDHPERGVNYALSQGITMMKGWMWEYIKLNLSFFGWYCLNGAISAVVLWLCVWPELMTVIQGEVVANVEQVMEIMYSNVVGSVASTLVSIPISLWLQPYHRMATAGFYHHRQEQVQPLVDYHYRPDGQV